MTKQSRALVLVALVGLAGVVALSMMAKRYHSIMLGDGKGASRPAARPAGPLEISPRPFPTARAPLSNEQVSAFIRVRHALRDAIDAGELDLAPEKLQQSLDRLQEVRERALSEQGVDAAGYDVVRIAYLNWKRDPAKLRAEVLAVLDARRMELEDADLGPFERLGL